MQAVPDFGLSNLKLAITRGDAAHQAFQTLPARPASLETIRLVLHNAGHTPTAFERIIVTGGRSGDLPDSIADVPIQKIHEVDAIGRGGLALGELSEALVVSCGTGTAMIAARAGACAHVAGTAVGGGTLIGLGQLLLSETQPVEIDALARAGAHSKVDLLLSEALGGGFGQLSADAVASNFGKVHAGSAPARADVAAGLVTMIAQTIALIAINAARAESLRDVVLVGRLASLPSIAAVLLQTSGLFGLTFQAPAQGGYANLTGALAAAGQPPKSAKK